MGMGWLFGGILKSLHFWQDVECGKVTLKSLFPELHSIARDKEALVSDYMNSSGAYVHWNPSFLRVV
jgi:hypothetical protein